MPTSPPAVTLKLFESGYSLPIRGMIFATLELMPNDPDGVWSTCDDYGRRVDLEDLVELSRLYETAMAELKSSSERARALRAAREKLNIDCENEHKN